MKKEKKSIVELINNIKLKNEIATIQFNFVDIKVNSYIPLEEKRILIDWVINNSRRVKNTNLLNHIDIEKKFDIALVNFYTDFKFDIINEEYYNQVYDILNSYNFFNLIIDSIPEEEYNYIKDLLQERIEQDNNYQFSMAASFNKFINDLKLNTQNTINSFKELKEFKIEDYNNIKNLAEQMGYKNKTTIEKKE